VLGKLVRVREKVLLPRVLCLSESQACILVSRPLGILDSSARLQLSSLVLSGANHIVRGTCTWRPPYFAEKFFNGKRDQGD